MSRKHYEWKVRDKTLRLGERTLVMGILNVTPDSFSDGGKYADPDRAFARALELEEQGADVIDIGAESTRPGSTRVSEAEELRRLIPVLKRLEGRLTVPLSVDTYKAAVAAKALELGADIINDPSGLTFDPDLARAAVKADAGLILNHMRGTPETWAKLPPLKDPISTIATELDSAMHRAVRAGLDRKRIVIDPGLGFGKRKEQNSEILARLDELKPLDLPLLVGASRKHFVAKPSEDETEFASAAAIAAAILYGAHIVRVHDVVAMKSVIEVADEIARARAEHEEAELAAKAALQEEAKRERSSGFRRDASPHRQDPSPRKFSVPVVTGVVRPSAFSPLRPALKPAAAVPAPESSGAPSELLASATPDVASKEVLSDESLPSYGGPDLAKSPHTGLAEYELDAPGDLSLYDEASHRAISPSPVQREFAAVAGERPKKESQWPAKEVSDRNKEAKQRAFRPAGPPFKRPDNRREDDDRRGRRAGASQGPPARRGAYGRPAPSDARRFSNRDDAPRESSSDGERPAFRGKPSFGKKPSLGKKPFGRKPFGDKPESGERPSFGPKKTFGGKPSFGPKKSFGGRPSFGEKPFGRKPFGDKPASGERPSFGPKKTSGGKPSFGPKKTFGGKPSFGKKPFGRKPAGKFSGKSGGKPSGRPSGRG